jgi:NAD(P)-dependent dehydrogenase (short-subunit alcohol dehydrogenase family)
VDVTLITGTSTGIGFETALQFARKGYRVHATMRNPERGAQALQDAAKAEGLELAIGQLDVDDPASVERAVAGVLDQEGRIDVLVNNAGIGTLVAVERGTEEDARATFETNFFGPLRLIRAVLPGMRERGSGTIVNVSSAAGRVAGAGFGMYAASKHALEALSEVLATETVRFGIRVAVIEPGFIGTPILNKANDSIEDDPGSPYADLDRRLRMLYAGALQNNTSPRVVAETIERAVSTDDPKLRYPVGDDAKAYIAGRRAMSDEAFIALGRATTDEEYWAEFAKGFAAPVGDS